MSKYIWRTTYKLKFITARNTVREYSQRTHLHNQLLINNHHNSVNKNNSTQRSLLVVTLKPPNLCGWSVALFILGRYPEHNGRPRCVINMCICKLPRSHDTWGFQTTVDPHEHKLAWIILHLCCADSQVGWVFQNVSRRWSWRLPGKVDPFDILEKNRVTLYHLSCLRTQSLPSVTALDITTADYDFTVIGSRVYTHFTTWDSTVHTVYCVPQKGFSSLTKSKRYL